jgi:hypothetical protein
MSVEDILECTINGIEMFSFSVDEFGMCDDFLEGGR